VGISPTSSRACICQISLGDVRVWGVDIRRPTGTAPQLGTSSLSSLAVLEFVSGGVDKVGKYEY